MIHRLACALLLAACLVIAGTAVAEDEAPAPAKKTPDRPSAEQLALKKLVDDVCPEVAKLRGLAWKHEVDVRVLSRKELAAWMRAGLERDVKATEWERDDRIVKRLGLLREDQNLRDLVQLMLQEMLAGAYDPRTKQLVLTAGFDGKANIPTLVHELIHALEDQHFDLLSRERPFHRIDPDRQFAIRCVFEGSAEWARRRFEDLRPDAALAYFAQRGKNTAAQAGQRRVLQQVPAHMLLSSLLHYRVGPNFVTHAVGADYAQGMAKLLADPPVSQEQVLHPYKWLGAKRDHPRKVNWRGDVRGALGKAWKRLDEHTMGELDLALYLDYFLGDKQGRLNPRTMGAANYVESMSKRAASGWDAGHRRYFENKDGTIVVAEAYAFDTVEDADDAARVLGAALRKAQGKAWKGAGWVHLHEVREVKRFDYTGKHGRGRILHRDNAVLHLDGVGTADFDLVFRELEKTTFDKDERDQGDDPKDPFDGYEVADHHLGLGLKLPDDTWEAIEGGRTNQVFAHAQKDDMDLEFFVLNTGVSDIGLRGVGRRFLGTLFDPAKATKTTVMHLEGIQHPLPGLPGWTRRIHIVSDAARTYAVIVSGPDAQLAKAKSDIERLLAGMPGPRGSAPTAKGQAPPAGLRSIPSY